MDNYLKELFNFLINGDNLTSALWGSRVLMSRFVFAYKLLKMNNMDEIKKFIYDGHKYVKTKLELKTGGIRQQLLLPSTFCAIKYQELENKVKCKAFWAGDSRGYVLTNNGLQLLTIDNENEATGGINNLFYESDEDHTRIDSLDYEFEMPCALFTCSDGIFDNREAIQIENIFIENLVESKDMEEYKNKLSQYFTDHLQDDSTIAMKFFGFDSFEQIKEYFKERYNKTKDLLNKVNENINYILLKQDELLYTDTKDVLLKCREKGHKLIINTARGFIATKPIIDEIKPDYSIVNAGALIFDKNEHIVYSNPIEHDTVIGVVKDIQNICESILLQTTYILYSNIEKEENETNKYVQFNDDTLNKILEDNVYKIVPKKLAESDGIMIRDKYDLDYCRYFSGVWSRFSEKKATKEYGMLKVVEMENEDINNTIAFGDDHGDLKMLLRSGVGVAMANSVEDVLNKVRNKTLSCDENGVAVFLEKFLNL